MWKRVGVDRPDKGVDYSLQSFLYSDIFYIYIRKGHSLCWFDARLSQ